MAALAAAFVDGRATLRLTNSTVSGNNASTAAGSRGGTVTLTNSTVSGNDAAGIGGGIDAEHRDAHQQHRERQHAAGSGGGGIFATTATLTNSTVSGNTADRRRRRDPGRTPPRSPTAP